MNTKHLNLVTLVTLTELDMYWLYIVTIVPVVCYSLISLIHYSPGRYLEIFMGFVTLGTWAILLSFLSSYLFFPLCFTFIVVSSIEVSAVLHEQTFSCLYWLMENCKRTAHMFCMHDSQCPWKRRSWQLRETNTLLWPLLHVNGGGGDIGQLTCWCLEIKGPDAY